MPDTAINLHRLGAGRGLRDADARRDLFERETGKRSQSAMTPAEVAKVAAALRRLPGTGRRDPREEKAHVRKVLAIWWKLWQAGAVAGDAKDGAAAKRALNGFIAGKTFAAKWGEVPTHYRFLSVKRANDVIEALKAIARREGVGSVR